jgi:8-oxo-dGTP pyrophosphatase MutT (NUDIX family)
MSEHIIYKVGLAIVKNRKLLLVREHGVDVWFIPGGRIRAGEDHPTALARETREELGTDLDPESMKLLGVFTDAAAGRPNTDVEISLYTAKAEEPYKASSEIAELGWFSTSSDQNLLSAIVRNKIVPTLHEAGLID